MRIIPVVALCGALALGGCAGTSQVQISADIQKVRDITTQACGYLPAVGSVAAIIASFINGAPPIVGIAQAAADRICAAVTAKSARYGSVRHLMVEGGDGRMIPLDGKRVN